MKYESVYRSLSDPQLVRALFRRDERAFLELRARHAQAVLVHANRTLQDEAAAEQVSLDVFVTLWHTPERYRPARGSVRTYLLLQARHRAIDVVRSEEARRRREELVGRRDLRTIHDLEATDPHLSERVHQALRNLRHDEADALRLAFFKGYTYLQVAQLMDQPEGTIKTKIRSAMRTMRSELGDLDPRGE